MATVVPPKAQTPGITASMKVTQHISTAELLHMRSGHCHASRINHMDIPGSNSTINCGDCITCLLSKPQRSSFPKKAAASGEKTAQIDISSYVPSTQGYKYLLLIGIKGTCGIWAYTIKAKADAKGCVANWLDTHLELIPPETKPTCIQSDNAMELDCAQLASQHGIKYRKTGTYSPQQNGFIERALAKVEKMMLALLIQSNLAKEYWPYAA